MIPYFLAACCIALVPGFAVRRMLYRLILGYEIDPSTRVSAFSLLVARSAYLHGAEIDRFTIINNVGEVRMEPGSRVGKFNYISRLEALHLHAEALILHRNFIGGAFGNPLTDAGRSKLQIGARSQLSISNFLDVSDTITLGEDVVVGGSGTQFWTHGFDHLRNRTSGPIEIADRVFIGSAAIIVQNIRICSDVSVGAGSVVHRSIAEPGLYASASLARKRSPIS